MPWMKARSLRSLLLHFCLKHGLTMSTAEAGLCCFLFSSPSWTHPRGHYISRPPSGWTRPCDQRALVYKEQASVDAEAVECWWGFFPFVVTTYRHVKDSFSGKPPRPTVGMEKQTVAVWHQLELGDACHHSVTQPAPADRAPPGCPQHLTPLLFWGLDLRPGHLKETFLHLSCQ